MRYGFRALAVAAFLLCLPGTANAYDIHLKGRHHERLTWLSELCRASMPAPARQCPLPASAAVFDSIPGPQIRKARFWRAARWPDDPTRQLRSFWTWPKFAVTARAICPTFSDMRIFPAGLTCGSHHGELQFMHAMRSARGETRKETVALVEGWARFTFRVASGAIGPDEDYCTAVRESAGAAAAALAPAGLAWCEPHKEGGRSYEAWRVGTLFSFHCDKMFSSKRCDVLGGGFDEARVRAAATGALLHLVQDSYSQSHAARGSYSERGPYTARVECQPVIGFYQYGANKGAHSAADKAPEFAETCGVGGPILDPVTAGARLLYFIDIGPAGEDRAMAMILGEVIGAEPG